MVAALVLLLGAALSLSSVALVVVGAAPTRAARHTAPAPLGPPVRVTEAVMVGLVQTYGEAVEAAQAVPAPMRTTVAILPLGACRSS